MSVRVAHCFIVLGGTFVRLEEIVDSIGVLAATTA